MAFSVDPDTCPTDLADARTALKKLLTGQSARVFVDQNGERVEFTAINLQALKDWITALEAVCGPNASTSQLPQRPFGFTF